MKKLFTACSILERDALQARLEAAGIASVSPARDMSRKVTNETTDMALNGYSILFDGFAVMIEDADEVRAQQVVSEFKKEFDVPAPSSETSPHWRKFYFSSVFSILLPLLMNGVALYHLFKAMKNREQPRAGYLVCAMFCFICSATF